MGKLLDQNIQLYALIHTMKLAYKLMLEKIEGEGLITDGPRDMIEVWVGEGEDPRKKLTGFGVVMVDWAEALHRLRTGIETTGYEWKPEGELLVYSELRRFGRLFEEIEDAFVVEEEEETSI